MEAAPFVVLLVVLSYSGKSNGLCNLENGTTARCHELGDVKYIETYDLESLKASVAESVLRPGFFNNLSSIRHLDLSRGNIKHIEPGSFRPLTNLRSLNLAENHIHYLELVAVEGLNHLHSLNLRKNSIQQLPPALARLKGLRHLDVQGNPLQCNCATLRVRDLIVKRGVKISKKVYCAGPKGVKGTPLFKPDAAIICNFEEQDREMQRDQEYKDSEEHGSGDAFDKLGGDDDDEYVEVPNTSSQPAEATEIETPYPNTSVSEASSIETTSSNTPVSEGSGTSQEPTPSPDETVTTTQVISALQKTTERDDEFFLDSDEKKEQVSTVSTTTEKKKMFKDALFYPVEGSGDVDEGSGEGSGTGMIFNDWKKADPVEKTNDVEDESSSSEDGLFDFILNTFWRTTEAPEVKKDPDLEEEHFIDATPTKEAEEEAIVPKKVNVNEGSASTTAKATTVDSTVLVTDGVELVDDKLHDTSKLNHVKVNDEGRNDELAEVSPTKQSKKGMGSYVVLAALLAILATLIGFAAYKGDFCKKKRKRGDVEHGTELKDMQKALLDTGNSVQPKVASNGTVESAPLVEDAPNNDEVKAPSDPETASSAPNSSKVATDQTDLVKPPRRTITPQENQRTNETRGQDTSSLKDDSLSGRTSSIEPTVHNGPMTQMLGTSDAPLSPGAQRVKITLQENPDSVPRTPILITKTVAGENLVKTA